MSANVTIEPFFHRKSGTLSYLVHNDKDALIIDPVIDLDLASGRLSHGPSDELLAVVAKRGVTVHWILETHAHADHLSGGDYLRSKLGAQLGIGRGIRNVQSTFEPVFDMSDEGDHVAFDQLFDDGDVFAAGEISVNVLGTPGHTDDSVTYVIGDAAFVGDTLFSPPRGTARCDFPGGSAASLYATIQKLYALPAGTRLFLCHDYPAADDEPDVFQTVEHQRAHNAHVKADTPVATFVKLRETRDATLSMPALIIPALQVNIRGGAMPAAAANGTTYLKLPINKL